MAYRECAPEVPMQFHGFGDGQDQEGDATTHHAAVLLDYQW
ncbi:hypothetical protein [Streptomyces sp. NPDC049906]